MTADYSNTTFNNVTILRNTAVNGYAGGIELYNSDCILAHVIIAENTAETGGGIYLSNSNSLFYHVSIIENLAEDRGGGIYLNASNPTLINVNINGNLSYDSGGIYSAGSILTQTNVTISGNTSNIGGGITLASSNSIITNSIIWGNSPESVSSFSSSNIEIVYSDIENGFAGEGNIDDDPLINDDFTLQNGSPCINTGHPNIWYQDIDETRNDMGFTGGLFVFPNFLSYDFGEVGGGIGSSIQFTLYNFRETPITISSVNFGTSSFTTTNTSFPITISPMETGIINITANNTSIGVVQDGMEIISEDLPEGLSVSLSVTGTEGNILTGNLSGSYEVATYRISGDLTIAEGDTAHLHAGTEFLFDGGVNFNIYGTLKAIGTEVDSIIFENYSNEKWNGFTLDGTTDETVFEYVRISGAEKDNGGGIYLINSNPILNHVSITGNTAIEYGGGIFIDSTTPTILNTSISGNTAGYSGGGIYYYELVNSDNILDHLTITDNMASNGGGIYLAQTSPTISNTLISGNTATNSGGGIDLFYSSPIIINSTIVKNISENGGGIRLKFANPEIIHVTISGNIAGDGSGIHLLQHSDPYIINSIIWDNSSESIEIEDGFSEPNIQYSNIDGGFTGTGNIDMDPLFINTIQGNYALQGGSPCIDTGIALEGIEYFGLAPDMGAFEHFCESELYDECGVCDGEGAIYECGCFDYPDSDCDCNGNILDECGVCGGNGVLDYCGVCNGENFQYFECWNGSCVVFEEDCPEEPCPDNYLDDCADSDCCPASWIADGYPDCEDQVYGCDLTCYDNDGGDCTPVCPDGQLECWDGSCVNDAAECPDYTCLDGYVEDCVDDDCCSESWIGDGYADCEDQAYGCDLTCYNNDGGDCDGRTNNIKLEHIKLTKKHVNIREDRIIPGYFSYSDIRNDCPIIGPDVGCDGICLSGMEYDECDVCDGDGSSCGLSGDLNSDGLINVLDVVMLVDIVLGNADPVDSGDMNGDGILNVLDVVMLVDIILNP